MTEPTRVLATFAADINYEDLPRRVSARVVDIVIDGIASALAGYQVEQTSQVKALAAALGGSHEATVIGGEKLSLAGAVLLNGHLTTAAFLCDVHRATVCHVTPEVLPPALAIAERRSASGRDFVAAVAVGLEVTTRISIGINYPAFRARGWNSPGVTGPFGGAAAAGRLLGLNANRMQHAFGLAGSQAAGTFAGYGTPQLKFHQSRGALSGLISALLAAEGYAASDEILVHPDGGLYNSYSDGGNPEAVTSDLGIRWELENIGFRPWPLGDFVQVPTALFRLIRDHGLDSENTSKVRVRVSPITNAMYGSQPWDRQFTAFLSIKWAVAVIVYDHQCWLDQFTASRLSDPEVNRFARDQVEVESDPTLPPDEVVVEVITTDGKRYAESQGLPDPMTRSEIVEKFSMAAAPVLSPGATERALGLLADIEQLADLGGLLACLRA